MMIPTSFRKEMNLAIIIPQLFHIMTLLVHIYEDSYMVRVLGFIFVSCFSYSAVHTVMERWSFKYNGDLNGDLNGNVDRDDDGGRIIHKNDEGSEKDQGQGKNGVVVVVMMMDMILLPGWPFLIGLILELTISLWIVEHGWLDADGLVLQSFGLDKLHATWLGLVDILYSHS